MTEKKDHVEKAIKERHSIRAFKSKKIPMNVVRNIVETALHAPSGGNLQPWEIHVVMGKALEELSAKTHQYVKGKSLISLPTEYHIYPPSMNKIHKKRRQNVAISMYELLGIERRDSAGRMNHFLENFRFFGAPCGLLFTLGREMQQGQWADVGMLMQNIMLLAVEKGLGTCSQEAWGMVSPVVYECLSIAQEQMLFCGMALGYPDWDADVNRLRTKRADSQSCFFVHGASDES